MTTTTNKTISLRSATMSELNSIAPEADATWLGTYHDNMQDCIAKGRHVKRGQKK